MKAPSVLEPSCGSCQFIEMLRRKFTHISHITGVEKSPQIYQHVKDLADSKTTILNQDFFAFQSNTKYDLIVGNPPYFQMKKQDVEEEYLKFIDGRPNAYVVFLLKSLSLLKENGVLSFVLPSTFLSCVSFDKTRRFISQNFIILGVEKCNDKYLETSQKTVVLTLQKQANLTKHNNQFTWKTGGDRRLVFGQKADIAKLKALSNKATTFAEMGFKVSLGHISWKKNIEFLTDNPKCPRIIYNSDIDANKMRVGKSKKSAKKHHIDVGKAKLKAIQGPFLLVNRGDRSGNYNFKHCFIEEGTGLFVVEKQLLLVQHDEHAGEHNKNICVLAAKSLANPKTREFIDLYLHDSVVSPVDFRHIFPFFHSSPNFKI